MFNYFWNYNVKNKNDNDNCNNLEMTMIEKDIIINNIDDIHLEAWFYKQKILKTKTNTTPFLERYFILKNGCLYYYNIVIDSKINIKNYKVDDIDIDIHLRVDLDGTNHSGYCFTLIPFDENDNNYNNENRMIIEFALSTEDKMIKWIDAIQNDNGNENMEEWLYVRKSDMKWKKFYVILEKTKNVIELSYREERGMIILKDAELDLNDSDGHKFTIKLNNGNYLNLMTNDTTIRDKWISAIKLQNRSYNNDINNNTSKLNLKEDIIFSNKIKNMINSSKIHLDLDSNHLNSKCFILSLDGGGLRGIIDCIILQRLLKIYPNLLQKVTFYAGCSIGGLLASSFACGYSPTLCREFLETFGSQIFNVNSSFAIWSSKFNNRYLEILVNNSFKDKKLGDLNKYLMIPAYLLDNKDETDNRSGEPVIFHNFTTNLSDNLLSDIVMRTTAAPVHFSPWQNYIDGGIFAHDPTSIALSLALQKYKKEDIIILSLGTGTTPEFIEEGVANNWGYYRWVSNFLTILWDGMKKKSNDICRNVIGERYHRLDPIIPSSISLDDTKSLGSLISIAKSIDLDPTIEWLKSLNF
jgi:predicted acylesterase/phospholipase RssA